MAQYSSSYVQWSITLLASNCPILLGYLSETDSVGLTTEILTLAKVKALNVAEHPRMILETVGRGSNISKLLLFNACPKYSI